MSMLPDEVILTFLFLGNGECTGACRWKKTHDRQSLALPDTVHSQEEEELPDFNINSSLLVSTQSSSGDYLILLHRRERDSASA